MKPGMASPVLWSHRSGAMALLEPFSPVPPLHRRAPCESTKEFNRTYNQVLMCKESTLRQIVVEKWDGKLRDHLSQAYRVKMKDDGPQGLPTELTWGPAAGAVGCVRRWSCSKHHSHGQAWQLCTVARVGHKEKSCHAYALPSGQNEAFKEAASESG